MLPRVWYKTFHHFLVRIRSNVTMTGLFFLLKVYNLNTKITSLCSFRFPIQLSNQSLPNVVQKFSIFVIRINVNTTMTDIFSLLKVYILNRQDRTACGPSGSSFSSPIKIYPVWYQSFLISGVRINVNNKIFIPFWNFSVFYFINTYVSHLFSLGCKREVWWVGGLVTGLFQF